MYGALCRARKFPDTKEPVQWLKQYLLANGITPRAWIVIVNAPQRLWLVVNRYYTSTSADQVLDLIKSIDRLGFDRAQAKWLLNDLLALHEGPGFRYTSYAMEIAKGESLWRHVVSLLQHIDKPIEA